MLCVRGFGELGGLEGFEAFRVFAGLLIREESECGVPWSLEPDKDLKRHRKNPY